MKDSHDRSAQQARDALLDELADALAARQGARAPILAKIAPYMTELDRVSAVYDKAIAALTARLYESRDGSGEEGPSVAAQPKPPGAPVRETQLEHAARLVAERPNVHYREYMPALNLDPNRRQDRNTARSFMSQLKSKGVIESAGEPGHWRPAHASAARAKKPAKTPPPRPQSTAKENMARIFEIVRSFADGAPIAPITKAAATKCGFKRSTTYAYLSRLVASGQVERSGKPSVFRAAKGATQEESV